jgi:hypothetical protein
MGAPNPFDFDARSVSFASDARRFTQSTMAYISIAGLTTSIERLCHWVTIKLQLTLGGSLSWWLRVRVNMVGHPFDLYTASVCVHISFPSDTAAKLR